MKVSQLLEDNNEDIIEELKSSKYDDYRDGINRLLNDDWSLVRGSDHYDTNRIQHNMPRKDRKPANTRNLFYYYAFKNLSPWIDLPSRSVICAKSATTANDYGNIFYVIPKNGATICTLPASDLWVSFDPERHFSLQDNLPTVGTKLTSLIEYYTGQTLTEDNFNQLISETSEKLGSQRIIDFPSPVSKNSMLNITLIEDFEDAVDSFFDISIKEDNSKTIKSDISLTEVWFSDEYITIPYRPITKYLAMNF